MSMDRVKVKICGITNAGDALKAVELGADALGFNFYTPSARYLAPGGARSILAEVPAHVVRIAVFVNEPRAKVRDILSQCMVDGQGFTGVQFHGDEDADYCSGWEVQVIKAFRVQGPRSVEEVRGYPADFYLLDSWAPGYGGSGSPFRWSWIQGVDRRKLILSGGLNPQNIAQAVREVRPYGVDVCSGVEAKPGIKDYARLKEFIDSAKAA